MFKLGGRKSIGKYVRESHVIENLEQRVLLAAQLVDDITTTPLALQVASHSPIVVGSRAYFISIDSTNESELWETDGTAAGTMPVPNSAPPSVSTYLIAGGNSVYYSTSDSIWKSDGTAGGTQEVAALPGTDLVYNNGLIYFVNQALDGTINLWRSDGTSGGTIELKSGFGARVSAGADPIVAYGGDVYFFASSSLASPKELWKTDGTVAGTTLISSSLYQYNNRFLQVNLVVSNNALFVFDYTLNAVDIYKYDGSTLSPIFDNAARPNQQQTESAADDNGTLVFTAYDSSGNYGLWKSDGTSTGTELVADITENVSWSLGIDFVPAGGTLYFFGYDAAHGSELWKSDLTAAGTMMVKDINPGPKGSNVPSVQDWLTPLGGKIYFVANDGVDGNALWESDGTADGTFQVSSVASSPGGLVVLGNELLFYASDPANGQQIWRSDGTSGGTMRATAINFGTKNSLVNPMANLNGLVIFTIAGALYRSDGTAGGTYSLNVANAQIALNSDPVLNGSLYFVVYDYVHPEQLWKTDGTVAGTQEVGVVDAPVGLPDLVVSNHLVFSAGADGLWRSDGTAAGTFEVKSLTYIHDLTDVNGTLFFGANDGTNGTELWQSDGTVAGTFMTAKLGPVRAGSGGQNFGSNPISLTNDNGTLFFAADEQENGVEHLWKHSGSTTTLVSSVLNLSPNDYPMGVVKGSVLFSASDGVNSGTLWESDGTVAGTIALGGPTTFQATALPDGSGAFYAANDSTHGNELWFTDGTPQGTVLLKDINVGSGDSDPVQFSTIGGLTYFFADDGVHGEELWQSDGTASGTVLSADIFPGSTPSNPNFLTVAGDTLFFAATDPTHGEELWKAFPDFAAISGETLAITPRAGNPQYNISTDGSTVNVSDGTNTLSFPSSAFTEVAAGGANPATLYFTAGAFVLGPVSNGLNLTVGGSAAVSIVAGGGTGINVEDLGTVNLTVGGALTLQNAASAAQRTVLEVGSLSIASGALLDLGSGDLVVHGGDVSTIRLLIAKGFHGGTWNGVDGITSSAAAVVKAHKTGLGYELNNNGSGGTLTSSFDTQPVTNTDVLVKYTLVGDANLDGSVNFADLLAVAQHYGGSDNSWTSGDFNYDGSANFTDLLALAQNYGQSLG